MRHWANQVENDRQLGFCCFKEINSKPKGVSLGEGRSGGKGASPSPLREALRKMISKKA